MERPRNYEHHRFVGDKRNRVVHDLDQATDACEIGDLMASERFASFGPDTLVEAANRGYKACRQCRGPVAVPADAAPVAVAAPAPASG
jgi:hypothetical protein